MAKFVKLLDLESFDNGQHRPPFLVPLGETVIGRGEYLKCKSTEVSRSHAVLKADKNGNLCLTTNNKKPCFYKKCGNTDKTILKENESVQLQHGDVFSLTALSSGYEIQVSDNLSSVLLEKNDDQELQSKPSSNGNTSNVTSPSCKRKFPSWMDDSDDEKQSPVRKKVTAVVEKKKASSDDTQKSNESCSLLASESGYSQENNQDSIECVKVSSIQTKDDVSPIVSEVINDTENLASVNYDSDQSNDTFFDPNEEQDSVENSGTSRATVNNQNTLDIPSTSQVQVTSQRPLCMYAEKCYRKNPQHKADFCHPGDPDFQPQQTSTTPKQCCPYGTSCYRVNPQHKQDFDHTQPPVSPSQTPTKKTPRKARQKKTTDKKKAGHWDSGSDESYDGSFIDDDENSSDDYRPDDVTESEDEDWE